MSRENRDGVDKTHDLTTPETLTWMRAATFIYSYCCTCVVLGRTFSLEEFDLCTIS